MAMHPSTPSALNLSTQRPQQRWGQALCGLLAAALVLHAAWFGFILNSSTNATPQATVLQTTTQTPTAPTRPAQHAAVQPSALQNYATARQQPWGPLLSALHQATQPGIAWLRVQPNMAQKTLVLEGLAINTPTLHKQLGHLQETLESQLKSQVQLHVQRLQHSEVSTNPQQTWGFTVQIRWQGQS